MQTLNGALGLLTELRPVTFHWKSEYQLGKEGLKELNYGFISQEVEQVFPEMVSETVEVMGNDTIQDFKVLDKDPLIAIMVKAIQEQQEQIDALTKSNETLNRRLDALLENETSIGVLQKTMAEVEKK